MENELKLVSTADGSNTLWNPQVGEHYHSKHGAHQESKHVFLKSGLEFYLERTGKTAASILEVGFGTGLNFLLTADYCTSSHIQLSYTGIEAFPIDQQLLSETEYAKFIAPDTWTSLLENYQKSLKEPAALNNYVSLQIAHTLLINFSTEQHFDVLYFDAFAAVHQPEMWTQEALAQCCQYLKSGGIFVTYAITGNLKRAMKALGFEIEKAPGAPGKREMLRAIKL